MSSLVSLFFGNPNFILFLCSIDLSRLFLLILLFLIPFPFFFHPPPPPLPSPLLSPPLPSSPLPSSPLLSSPLVLSQTGCKPSKQRSIQMSNWAARTLNNNQVTYAAHDAVMGRDIYDHIASSCKYSLFVVRAT